MSELEAADKRIAELEAEVERLNAGLTDRYAEGYGDCKSWDAKAVDELKAEVERLRTQLAAHGITSNPEQETKQMTNRERNAAVAKLMRWIRDRNNGSWRDAKGKSMWSVFVWNPTEDANHDYEVLKWVRKNWLYSRRQLFQELLCFAVRDRLEVNATMLECWAHYEPGDYTRAALAAERGE